MRRGIRKIAMAGGVIPVRAAMPGEPAVILEEIPGTADGRPDMPEEIPGVPCGRRDMPGEIQEVPDMPEEI